MDPRIKNAALALIPRRDAYGDVEAVARERGRMDLAPLWIDKLRYTAAELLELEYPELPAAMGQILPIDNSPSPEQVEWSYWQIERFGYASWIDDDGKIAPNGAAKFREFNGRFASMGHNWDVNIEDLERASASGYSIESIRGETARRAHEAKAHWTWLMGDSEVNLHGLCTHPNIRRVNAPLNAGNTSRLWPNKSDDEILADLALLIDTVAIQTLRAEYVATVYMPHAYFLELKNRILGTGDGGISLWDWVKRQYSGDDSGQGKVEFKILNECTAANRVNPEQLSDTSGIVGDFMIALPANDKKKDAFFRSRPFTVEPPQRHGFNLSHYTRSRIGGFRTSRPLAFHIMYFGLT